MFFFALLLALPVASPSPPPVSFERCGQLAARQPEGEETARCLDEAGDKLHQPMEAADGLRELLREHPGSPWPTFFLAYREPQRSEELFRQALAGFAARRDAKGEVLALGNLQYLLFGRGRLAEAAQQVEQAMRVAAASGQPEVIARANILKARHLRNVGSELEQAWVLLQRAEAVLFPRGSYYTKKDCLSNLGNLSLELGRFREGFDAFQRMAEAAAAERDLQGEAAARYGMVRAVMDENAELPSEAGRRRAVALGQAALATAVAASHRTVQSKLQLMLVMFSRGEDARRHFEACLDVADTPRDQSHCLNGFARVLAATDPGAAQKVIDRSLSLARRAQDYWSMAFAWREQMHVSWASGSGEKALADSRSALDAIEALRDLQASSSGQAEAFATWSEDYYWLSGRLLEASLAGGGEPDLDLAFGVAERLRARTLISTLENAHALPAVAAPLRQQRAAVLEKISTVQGRLLDPELPAAERAAANRELAGLEIEEIDLRNQLARMAPALANPRRPDFVTLARVRQSLGPDEALLSFQIAPWEDVWGGFGGGSWLIVMSRAGPRVYRLPGRGELRNAVRLFKGSFEPRNGGEAAPAAGLYRQLLERPLRELPPGIRRLVLVPDDVLHQLPFAALRASPQAPPLASRFQLIEVPSATLWLDWQQRRAPPSPIPALALADPPLPGAVGESRPAPAKERAAAAVFASGVRLGPLPYARRESQAVVRNLGGGSMQRVGREANEAFLKSTPLTRFGVLHFATHAVTDESNPDRSGVLLAPGAANQDGLLQIREIVDLDLRGRVVVLSACSSNTGALLRGEGVMSLARAFFQAGARTVVASLWRLRDDEAADFFDRFYRHLGQGASVAAALQGAQVELIKEGAPAAAWAGIVALGDGSVVPLPGGRRGWDVPIWAWGLVGAGLLLIAGAAYRRRHHTME
jgi:CHAT domain-containing protein/tetratricopeptide (TPR) repeat protein